MDCMVSTHTEIKQYLLTRDIRERTKRFHKDFVSQKHYVNLPYSPPHQSM